MRILWITNIPLPPICRELGWPPPAVGGWMYSSLKRLKVSDKSLIIAVATVYDGYKMIVKDVDCIRYYLLPLKDKSPITYNPHLESFWRIVKGDFKPDVVHIHGSEFPHGLAYVNACGASKVVVSIQGIISRIARYYTAGIDYKSVKKCLTFRDFIKRDNLLNVQGKFEERGRLEIKLLHSVNYVIGRTNWDRTHVWAINPYVKYYYCGETLRDSFYCHKWAYDKCEPYTIFVSQASYPIKGLHKLLEAMPLVLREFPNAKIYAAGNDPTASPWWRINGYGMYLKRLTNRFNLKENIKFLGMLSEEEMCRAYLRANIFVCPSSIENSPNSLGEAQLLEMPYVASFVGGTPEIVDYNPNVLYRFEETEMLANKICNVFKLGNDFIPYKFDKRRYDGQTNTELLNDIYINIANS